MHLPLLRRAFAAPLSVSLCAMLFAGAARTQSAMNEFSPLGMNLSGVAYWSTEWVFVDIFKSSERWLPQRVSSWEWNTGAPLDLDADGWIRTLASGQAAGTILCGDIGGQYPAGRYVCLYDGDGDIEFYLDARVASRQTGRIELQVSPSNAGIHLKLVRTNPSNPVRNIRVVMPGFEATHQSAPFHPQFLQRWSPYRVLRFMDWGHTNNSTVREWQDRTRPAAQTQGGKKGAALEYMIDLANTLEADPWFCIPHLASDDYVRNFAALVRDRLKPNLRAHVEYSNEVWNGIFDQYYHAEREGLRLGLAGDGFTAALRYFSQRSVEIFAICDSVLGRQRLVRVLAGQNGNPWVGKTVMDWRDAYRSADVYAVAPYFGNGLGDASRQWQVVNMSVQQIVNECIVSVPRTLINALDNANNARQRGLRLAAYEGGQHLVGVGSALNNQALADLFSRVNRHPDMGRLTQYLLDGWRYVGGTTFVYFNSMGENSRYGNWGTCEYESPNPLGWAKYYGQMVFYARNLRWW
jgi:hypothetical protein